MIKVLRQTLLISLCLTGLCGMVAQASPDFHKEAWLADFEQLKRMISETYPNLEAQVASQKLDLFEMDHQTKASLEKASSDQESAQILRDFVARFKDGHFHIEAGNSQQDPELGSGPPLAKSADGLRACEQMMGEWKRRKTIAFGFPTPNSLGFSNVRVQGSAFPWTTLQTSRGKLGLVRIVSFGQGDYPELCIREWESYRQSLPATCDRKCQEKFVYERLSNVLLKEFGETLKELKKEKISGLVLDVAGNGGGTNWVSGVIRMLTAKPILCGGFGFIRHPHWVKHFEEDQAEAQASLKTATGEEKKKLQAKLMRVEADLAEARKICDRSVIWTRPKVSPPCSLVALRTVTDCSPSEELRFEKGLYDGPLFVLANRKTASASEDLVGRYKDSGVAKILGEKTLGSGCGFTNGGLKLNLKNSGLRVVIPDCARFLRDGTNEVLGIAPDIELPMSEPLTEEFSRRLKTALEK